MSSVSRNGGVSPTIGVSSPGTVNRGTSVSDGDSTPPSDTFNIILEDNSGVVALETSGNVELEVGP